MSESAKTIAFVVLGALAVGAAYFIDRPTAPVNVNTLVGTTLNSEFGVDAPKRLQIVKFDRETAKTKQFEVASTDGVWRIPSKQDYPADATQQMAAAANALIDRKVLRVAAQTAQEHEALGVVDPQSAKLDSNSEGVGTRVVMSDADGKTLVDMIIGKKVKDAEGQRYVRNSNQDVVYIVELDPTSLSTGFEDWIEDDLLQLAPFDLQSLFINDYSVELSYGMSQDGRIQTQVSWDRRSEIKLDYDVEAAKWALNDLKGYDRSTQQMTEQTLPADDEVNQEAIDKLRDGLDDLLIVDIAKKPTGLSDDLKAGSDFMTNQEAFRDLIDKGFSPVPLKPGAPPEILSSEGELVATQRDGVEYVLRFGKLQLQTETAEGEAPVDPAAAEEAAKAAAAEDGKDLRRYLFVMARFNEDAIPKPQLKELPGTGDSTETKEEAAPAEAAEPAAEPNPEAAGGDQAESLQNSEPTDETAPADAAGAAAKPATAEPDAEKPAEETPAAAPAAPAKPSDEAPAAAEKPADQPSEDAAAERAAIEQENQRLQDEYNETVAKGKKRVAELNQRFGDWYYVISNDVYKQIHLSRDQVFKKKGAESEGVPADDANPLQGLPNLPIGAPPAE
ncbi:DUF4340 domain-containing protein [Lacipirellula parvula]|uniref:DUF4340 domain-containing protein n=1 Tax=Lacipirellula parvula TaxID=2650471 RepID=A0A5K7XK89_9BACT|nr:DUF4340 domain-containing protein [Lacipirellula parvula]BBO35551.1 hypothetical protein PLANPX_5163 [Lacipirellula parvula]